MTNEEVIQQIKDVGESIIENAECIVMKSKYQTKIKISFEINYHDLPEIKVETGFLSDNIVNKYTITCDEKLIKTCPKCGKKYSESERYCTKCGCELVLGDLS